MQNQFVSFLAIIVSFFVGLVLFSFSLLVALPLLLLGGVATAFKVRKLKRTASNAREYSSEGVVLEGDYDHVTKSSNHNK
jgi:hypothetical protein